MQNGSNGFISYQEMPSDHNVDGAGAGVALQVGVVSLQVEVSVPDRQVAYSSGASQAREH